LETLFQIHGPGIFLRILAEGDRRGSTVLKARAVRKILIIGATSAIAQATEELLAEAGAEMFLVARNRERLDTIRDDLVLRFRATIHLGILDAQEFERHDEILSEAFERLGRVDLVIIAHGCLPDQRACEASPHLTLDTFSTNALSVIALLTHLAPRLEAQGHGTVAVISSVAGDRGRRSNYVYGSTKGAVSCFLQGLRSRLHPSGIRVVTVKPGLVDTPMTAGFRKGFLWASAPQVAKGLVRALEGSKDVVYLPWHWRWIMLVVRMLPERMFKRLSF
jgi:decaprenylphospho-beta-D-erythro-pentofuranosid-2-ulose 2-reductase